MFELFMQQIGIKNAKNIEDEVYLRRQKKGLSLDKKRDG
jgi:hypothetical protein